MKLAFLAFPALLLFFAGSPQERKSASIEGAWKLVQVRWVNNDTLAGDFPGKWTGSDMKMWSKGYFSFVGHMKETTGFTDSYGGGRYHLDGNRYEEEIQFHVAPTLVGQKVKMLLEVKNDTLIQTWPVSENGQIDKGNYTVEKYVRLD